MKLSEWKQIILGLYEDLPKEYKTTYINTVFRNIAFDISFKYKMEDENRVCENIMSCLIDFVYKPSDDKLDILYKRLENYYDENKYNAEIERQIFKRYKNKPLMPMFVLSYGRWKKNATLDFLEKMDSEEIYHNTFVFIDEDQEEEYKNGHPKFTYYSVNSKNVGERMKNVLEFCKKWNIDRAFILEDDIAAFNVLVKCGLNKCRMNRKDEQLSANIFKYIQYTGSKIMDDDPMCSMVRVRNRFHSNTEQSSVCGYNKATIGGTPDLCWFLDINRFYEIYKQIPERHYSPQYDWAILCSMIKNRSTWYVLTGLCKNESMGNSVIKDDSDRDEIAEEIVNYYGVSDIVSIVHVKNTGGKIKLRVKRKNGIILNYGS